MKDIQTLKKRGYVEASDIDAYRNYSKDECLKLVNDKDAAKRTCGIYCLSKYHMCKDDYRMFISLFIKETALYTRLMLAQVLAQGNHLEAGMLCDELGLHVNEQYQQLPLKISKKKTYLLPRDLFARVLREMNPQAISPLIEVLTYGALIQVREALDAFGFMIYHDSQLAIPKYIDVIQMAHQRFFDDEVIVWKCIQCCAGFPLSMVDTYLNDIKKTYHQQVLQDEIKRTLNLIREHGNS